MCIYDGYNPTKADLAGKVEVVKCHVNKSRKVQKMGYMDHEARAEKNPDYVTPDLRKKYMSDSKLVNSPFKNLK